MCQNSVHGRCADKKSPVLATRYIRTRGGFLAQLVAPYTPSSELDQQYNVSQIVREILQNVPVEERYGRPFKAAYQLAADVARVLAQQGVTLAMLGIPLGGRESGEHRSLAKMLAQELPSWPDIEVIKLDTSGMAFQWSQDGLESIPSGRTVSAHRLRLLSDR